MYKKEILIKKCNITKKIYTCTKEINKAIDKKDTQKILELLDARQNLINESNKIDSNIKNIKNLVRQAEDDLQTKKILDEINTILKYIKDIDDENRKKSSHFTGILKEKISDLKQTGNAMKGYGIIGGGTTSEGAFIDTKH